MASIYQVELALNVIHHALHVKAVQLFVLHVMTEHILEQTINAIHAPLLA